MFGEDLKNHEDNAEECSASRAPFDWCSVRPPGGGRRIVSPWLVACLGDSTASPPSTRECSPAVWPSIVGGGGKRLHEWWLNKTAINEVEPACRRRISRFPRPFEPLATWERAPSAYVQRVATGLRLKMGDFLLQFSGKHAKRFSKQVCIHANSFIHLWQGLACRMQRPGINTSTYQSPDYQSTPPAFVDISYVNKWYMITYVKNKKQTVFLYERVH